MKEGTVNARSLVAGLLADAGALLIDASCRLDPVWMPAPTPEAVERMAAFRAELVAAVEERNARPIGAVAVETCDETSAGQRSAETT